MDIFVKNREAYYNFTIIETYEAGIALKGDEVKSIRLGKVSLKGSFVSESASELYTEGLQIQPYDNAYQELSTVRSRKLLLHKREILKILQKQKTSGVTCVPLSLYFKRGRVKLKLGLVKGKKLHDKREAIKKRDLDREKRKF